MEQPGYKLQKGAPEDKVDVESSLRPQSTTQHNPEHVDMFGRVDAFIQEAPPLWEAPARSTRADAYNFNMGT